MNLRESGGKVPVFIGGDSPYTLVEFPSKTVFVDLYPRNISKDNVFRYWEILLSRSKGATLSDAAEPHGLSKERIRQIEANFLRLFRQHYFRLKADSWPWKSEFSSKTD